MIHIFLETVHKKFIKVKKKTYSFSPSFDNKLFYTVVFLQIFWLVEADPEDIFDGMKVKHMKQKEAENKGTLAFGVIVQCSLSSVGTSLSGPATCHTHSTNKSTGDDEKYGSYIIQ